MGLKSNPIAVRREAHDEAVYTGITSVLATGDFLTVVTHLVNIDSHDLRVSYLTAFNLCIYIGLCIYTTYDYDLCRDDEINY